MSHILRPYQRAAIDAVLSYWADGGENPLVEMATGTGKSMVQAVLLKELLFNYPSMRVICLVHSRELVSQNAQAILRSWPQAPIGINSAGLGRRDKRSQILFASIQSVFKDDGYSLGERELVMIDECFAGDTLVLVEGGERRIDALSPGDAVLNATGIGNVISVSKRISNTLTIRLSNERHLRVSDNHRFFTAGGWLPARELAVGTRLFSREDVHSLWQNFLSKEVPRGEVSTGKTFQQESLLLDILLEEARQSYEQERFTDEDARYPKEDQACSDSERRKRQAIAIAAVSALARPGRGMAGGICCENKRWSFKRCLSELLQVGYCKSIFNDWYRTGRWLSRLGGENKSRYQERRSSDIVRVEDISRNQRERPETVFNLHVSGHPSYFAGGILVHNCHLTPPSGDGMYRTFLQNLRQRVPDLRVAGMTATPFRAGSGRLDEGEDRLFHKTVFKYGIGQGIADGFLSPLISKATATAIDLSGVKVEKGEFVQKSLEVVIDQDWVTKSAVGEIVEFGAPRKAWIVFCTGVDHATHVRDEIRQHNISCETVNGKTPKGERDSILNAFKRGQIRCLTNCSVLTIGFDAPLVDMIADLNPTMSAGRFVQKVGRGTRLAPDKIDCLYLDFGGNVKRHGPVDAITGVRPKKKAGEAEAVLAKECPNCATLLPLNARQCSQCDYIYPEREPDLLPKHDAKADAERPILSTAAPVWIAVSGTRAFRHEKFGSPASMRVEYFCGLTSQREWVCFEHPGMPRAKAERWWRGQGGALPVPRTVDEALARFGEIKPFEAIQVRPNGKFFDIVGRRLKTEAAA